MSLHVKRHEYAGTGDSGTPLLLIHGWGMHGGMWDDVAERFSQHFPVLAVDLPGHGYSEKSRSKRQDTRYKVQEQDSHFTLDGIVDRLSEQFSGPLTLCGWSLGGQIAMRWAMRDPQQVERLVLVSSTPCFAQRSDWPFAMPQQTLLQFAGDLEKNHAATLRRFLGLQVRGSEGERELLATLRASLSSRGEPNPEALRGGLKILRDLDMRNALPEMKQPALVIAGERDRLTPPQASHYLAQAMPNARVVEIRGAAHAPFLSHPDEFVKHVIDFMKGKNN
ncbi:MAG: pimeloyl-ACP methyl ester esterase BioH [Gallionella sp.]